MKQLLKKIKQISMLLLVISLIGCENDETILPEVISSFTHTINADTGTVTFINTSVNSNNYFWTFGDGTSSTEINPVKTYTTGEYKVTLKATNVAGASDTSEDIIVISDAGAPVITLLGETTINMMIGGTFTDPGATATDEVDGDLTANIVVGGDTVDEGTAGTYVITYNVSDTAGNAATERTRTVIVAADIVKPVITLLGDATVNLTVGDTYTEEGATASDDVDGDISANIVVAGDAVDVNTAATYTITYNVSDAAGNAATEVTRKVIVAAASGTSGAYIYSTAGIVDIITVWSDWSTGTVQDGTYDQDATYNPSIKLSGTGSWGTVVAFTEIPAGKMAEYGNLEFKIKSSDATVKVKVPEVEKEYTIADGTALADGWVQMSIPLSDFGAAVDTATELAIFGSGNATLYLTDIMLSGEGSGGGTACTDTALVLPIDFDCEGIDYASKIVGDVSFSVIDNPELTGINNVASKVGSIVNVGANWENAFFNFDTPIDFSANNTIKFKFYSTVSVDLKLKMEDGTAGPVEVDVNHGGTGWEELSFTFTNSDSYNDMVLFVDGPGTTAGTFYIDDIEQVASTGGGGGATSIVNGDFETGDKTGWLFFDVTTTNGGSVSVTNAESNGGTYSAKITSGQFNNPGIKQERFGAGTILPNTQYQVKLDSKVESLVDGAVVNVLAFSESAIEGDPAILHNLGTINVTPGSWNTNTLTFTTGGTVSGGVSLLIEVVCGGATTCNGVVYIDNVSFN